MSTHRRSSFGRWIACAVAPLTIAAAVAIAPPASAGVAGGVASVGPAPTAGSLTVTWESVSASSTYFLGIAEASTGIADCDWRATWLAYPDRSKVGNSPVYTAAALTVVTSVVTSPIHGLWGGSMTVSPGASYLVCLFDLATGIGSPVLGVAGVGGTPAPDVIQQVGLPLGGSCEAFVDTSLNWSGVPNGGWTKSWAQWAVASTGGPVCTRTLSYDHELGRYVITP